MAGHVREAGLFLFVGRSEEKIHNFAYFTLEYFIARDSSSSWSLNFVLLFILFN